MTPNNKQVDQFAVSAQLGASFRPRSAGGTCNVPRDLRARAVGTVPVTLVRVTASVSRNNFAYRLVVP